MKLVAYLRVSGLGQVDRDGEARQTESVEKFCAAHALLLGEKFFEAGVSGTIEGLDRPEFTRMLETSPDAIVVERLDRIARDLMVQELIIRELRTRGIQLFAADQGALIDQANDTGDPTRKLLRQILGAVAEWEKSALVKKLRAARDRKRKSEGRCEGRKPFGSQPKEKIVQDLILSLHTHGNSYAMIARILSQEGFVTRYGQAWNKASVYNCVRGKITKVNT